MAEEQETEKGARLQFGPDGYRIAVGEEVSEASDFGVPLEFTAEDGTRYIGFADLETSGDPETHLDYWLYEADPVECEPEEVDSFEDEEEDDEDDEDEPLVTTNGGGGKDKEAAD